MLLVVVGNWPMMLLNRRFRADSANMYLGLVQAPAHSDFACWHRGVLVTLALVLGSAGDVSIERCRLSISHLPGFRRCMCGYFGLHIASRGSLILHRMPLFFHLHADAIVWKPGLRLHLTDRPLCASSELGDALVEEAQLIIAYQLVLRRPCRCRLGWSL